MSKVAMRHAIVLGAIISACGSVAVPSAQAAPAQSVQTQWGSVSEPALPGTVCATLTAAMTPVNGSIDMADGDPSNSQPDLQRIQRAIDACPSGQAVKLVRGASGASGFISGPLKLRSGVKLWIDGGVTLFASRNPRDYDNGVGTCGTATASRRRSCNPFILAAATVGSGIVGDGAIDGRGGSVLTSGANAGRRSWWDVAFQNKTEQLSQQNPLLIQIQGGSDFTLYRAAVLNAPNFHIVTGDVSGITAWGIKILSPSLEYTKPGYACPADSTPDKTTPATCFTPETVKNTDGFDPGRSDHVLLAHSYVSVGDDNVAVKSHGKRPSTDLAFTDNHFYYGHGMSIGSETDAGLRNMVVTDLAIDGFDSTGGIGLRIKSDASRGGKVDGVTYRGICMRNVRQPLIFDSYYRPADAGTRYPLFTNIKVSGLHSFGSRKYGGGQMTFAGFNAAGQRNPLSITLDNVVFDGPQPTFGRGRNGDPSTGPTGPGATHFVFGPGAVSFAPSISPSSVSDLTVSTIIGTSTPVDCSAAFVPLSSVLASSPI
ncbi:glycoside hydrolase family 28 protein [Variovorax sp. RT4R15]|uniref:glycoside hydrolase family 28 protein n=1 Tax=Variovorax sp. RT4R15 TaxID=3443737 RepID=UPI003F46F456